MKKTICLILVLVLSLSVTSAFAAGKLSTTQENFHYISGYWNYGYAYAKVENIGDKPIKVNAGVLEMYDAEGEVITSTDWAQSYATYLQPGEYTYVSMYEDLEEGAEVPEDYMMTLTGKSDTSKTALRLPVETKLELGVADGWWEYDYMFATVTNNTDEPLYSIEVVFALLDAEGNILNIESKQLYNELALMPGSSMIVRKEISSSFMDYFEAKGIVPASVDALAYVLIDNE